MSDLDYLRDRFAYFTECQLATVEWFEARKSYPHFEKVRHCKIADNMVEICKAYGIKAQQGTPRLNTRLSQGKSGSLPK